MHHRATNKDAYDLDFITEMIPLTELLKAKNRYAKRLRQGGIFYRKVEEFNPNRLIEFESKQENIITMTGFLSKNEAIERWVHKVNGYLRSYNQSKLRERYFK